MRALRWLPFWRVFLRCAGRLSLRHMVFMARRFACENPRRIDGRFWVNTFFPPYPSAGFERFLHAVLQRRRVPYSVYFAVTGRCPYSCGHCSYGRRAGGEMETEQAKALIAQIESLGTAIIGFTGGEPLLRPDIVELVAAAGPMSRVMFSTGHGLTPERAGALKTAGLDALMIGLESDNAQQHDATRQRAGSFDEGIAAIKTGLDAGLYVGVSTVATPARIDAGTIQRLAELAENSGAYELRLLEPVATGTGAGDLDLMLTEQHSRKMQSFHIAWNRRRTRCAAASFAYLESDDMFGCGAGYHHLFIDAAGNVCPCDLTPLTMGNICDEPLEAIWQRMERWFARPRCGCFAKALCRQSDAVRHATELPLNVDQSASLCDSCRRPHDRLPAVYASYFRDRAQVDRPATRR